MAAGLTLAESDYPAFVDAFDAEVSSQLSDDDLATVIWSDGELAASELSLDTAQQLRAAGPWGQGFPAPVFDGEFRVLAQRVVGERHLKLSLEVVSGGTRMDAIAFNTPALPADCDCARMAYRLDVNEYRGLVSPQLVVEYIETS